MPEIKFEFDEEYAAEKIRNELSKCANKEKARIKNATGLEEGYINNMLQRGSSRQKFSLPVIHLFAKAIGKPVEYFLYGEDTFMKIIENEYIKIKQIESLTDNDDHLIYKEEDSLCAVKLSILMSITKDPFKTILFRVDSDTMETTFSKNDELLIDTSIKSIKDGGIYAFNSYDIKYIRIRRFFCQINTILLIADNPKYESCVTSPKDINIIGRVILTKHFL